MVEKMEDTGICQENDRGINSEDNTRMSILKLCNSTSASYFQHKLIVFLFLVMYPISDIVKVDFSGISCIFQLFHWVLLFNERLKAILRLPNVEARLEFFREAAMEFQRN